MTPPAVIRVYVCDGCGHVDGPDPFLPTCDRCGSRLRPVTYVNASLDNQGG